MEEILEYITIYAPVLVAIFSEIGVVAALIYKITDYFTKANKAVEELKESNEYKEIKNQIKLVVKENKELKTKLNNLLEKISHVKVEDEEFKDN